MTPELFYAPASPFARKVRVTAAEAGIALHLTEVSASPVQTGAALARLNPLGKIPCLRTEEGEVLYDSRVICRYLGASRDLYPAGAEEWRALRREALADGLMEAALLTRYETVMRPEPLRWTGWIEGQMAKIAAALDAMDRDGGTPGRPDIGDLATGCALFYLDFRFPDLDWRADHPGLAELADGLGSRPSFKQTRPA